jgi:hypothetical protein
VAILSGGNVDPGMLADILGAPGDELAMAPAHGAAASD